MAIVKDKKKRPKRSENPDKHEIIVPINKQGPLTAGISGFGGGEGGLGIAGAGLASGVSAGAVPRSGGSGADTAPLP
jgi:hypothetical protein